MSSRRVDIAIVGAGPAGARAALAARRCGCSVLLIDEYAAPGGQVYRREAAPKPRSPGEGLRAELREANIETLLNHRVFSVQRNAGFELLAYGPDGTIAIQSDVLIAATGGIERIIPFAGWTLPGVIGLGAVTVMTKSHGVAPGERVVLAGCGPLLYYAAALVMQRGSIPAAVVDSWSFADWMKLAPALALQPALLAQGAAWMAQLRFAGVPVYSSHVVVKAEGKAAVSSVVISRIDDRGGPTGPAVHIAADALAVGSGLVPNTEITRLLGAAHVFDRNTDAWTAVTDANGQTSVAGLYLAGDGAGILGAAAAELSGTMVGHAVAHRIGRLSTTQFEQATVGIRAKWHRLSAAGRGFAALTRPRPDAWQAVSGDTVVCRCEDVTRGEIEAAAAGGAGTLDQLKVWTRCGMGACQGRYCGETAAALLAPADRSLAGMQKVRLPLRPVPLAAFAVPDAEARTTSDYTGYQQ